MYPRRETWLKIGLPIALYKLGFYCIIFLSTRLLPELFNIDEFYRNFYWPPDAVPGPWAALQTWDAQHYLYIAQHGYSPASLSNAFYPLWPMLIKFFSPFCAGNFLLSGLVLANFFSLIALMLLYEWVSERFSTETALYTLLAILACPGSMYFQFLYSESLFILLLVLLLLALQRENLLVAAAAALLLPLSRPVGILIYPFLVVMIFKTVHRPTRRESLLLLAPLAGFALYLMFMAWQTTDAWAGFRAGYQFTRSTFLQSFDAVTLVREFFHLERWHGWVGSFFDRFFFVIFLAGVVGLFFIDWRLAVLALPLGIIPATSIKFISTIRYIILIVPVFVVYGKVLARLAQKSPILVPLLLLMGFALQLIFLLRFVNNFWVA